MYIHITSRVDCMYEQVEMMWLLPRHTAPPIHRQSNQVSPGSVRLSLQTIVNSLQTQVMTSLRPKQRSVHPVLLVQPGEAGILSGGRILVPCPSTSNQGGKGGEGGGERKTDGESVKEAPKPTPMSRGAGARKMKSSASPAVKSESGDKRRAVTSSSISSPPKSNSTPLLISR